MSARQILLGVCGLLCLGLGLVGGGVGSLVTEVFSGTGADYKLMMVLSAVALVAAVPVVVSGRERNLDQAETPDPEVPVDVPPAGREFDETIQGWRFRTPLVGISTRKQVKRRLRKAAVEAVMRAENCDRSRARRLVRRGDWTDDSEAAAFLGNATQSVVRTTAAALPRRVTPVEYRVRRTVEAIYGLERGDSR
ncbi:hypothetical protein ACH9L7_18170 (plasmid) [Haloferax sp. S1W]|uniref:DUF7269 family protein n=1 Tax=Haloferax sp. S1W TaxID=3377110 RepID=UPI0037CBB025